MRDAWELASFVVTGDWLGLVRYGWALALLGAGCRQEEHVESKLFFVISLNEAVCPTS